MKVRAKQSTQINTKAGLLYVKGPEMSDKDEVLSLGEVVEVPDDYPINIEVWDIVEPPAGQKPKLINPRQGLDGDEPPVGSKLQKGTPALSK